jgi:hypothetical protein
MSQIFLLRSSLRKLGKSFQSVGIKNLPAFKQARRRGQIYGDVAQYEPLCW